MRQISDDLEKIAKQLDISLTMYKNATEKYESISKYLDNNGIVAHIYPQGSFRTGTVVRPTKNSVEANYDLDVICESNQYWENTNPKYIKNSIGDILKNSDLYGKKLLPEDSICWTLEYAEDSNEVGFLLDIVPAAINKSVIGNIGKYIEKGIKITVKNKENNEYSWKDSNPEGTALWFDEINSLFLNMYRRSLRESVFYENRNLFSSSATIEDVPDSYLHTALQRCIQLIKRHRDNYYERANKLEYKPTSHVILILISQIAKDHAFSNIYDLLKTVLLELNNNLYKYIDNNDDKFVYKNPINESENIIQDWNKNHYDAFKKWINEFLNEVDKLQNSNENAYQITLRTMFGDQCVKRALPIASNYEENVIKNGVKPWKI